MDQKNINHEENPVDNRSKLQKRVDAMSEKTWNLWQTVCGALLGGVVSFFLFGGSGDDMSTYAIYALVIALVVPKLAENTFGRNVNRGRTALAVSIAMIMAAYMAVRYM